MRKAVHFLRTHRATEIALLVLISLIAASNWFNSELPKGHDAVGSICSVAGVKHFLLSYDTVFHWSAYGALGGFYLSPPLFGYLLTILSYPFTWAVASKLLFLLIFTLSGVFAYYYIYELTKNRLASFVSGLTYIFVPYYLIEVVFEGHWDIGLAYMLTPLVFLATEKAIQYPKATRIALAGVLLALLILTFPQIFPLLIGPFWGLYVLFRIWLMGKQRFRATIITCFLISSLGLLLTAFWWFPLLWEIDYLHTPYPLEAAEGSSATFIQAITLRPSLCCSPSSPYGASGSILLGILQVLPLILVLLGIILNRKNKYIWFFSASFLITVFLAMGPDSPINIFGVAHQYIPFFSYLRTPVRFLLFANLAQAVLIGFCVKGITEWFKRIHLKRLEYVNVPLVLIVLVSLIVVANTWRESRAAFSTFSLPADQENTVSWLNEQENGDYYIADLPLGDPYLYELGIGYIVNPTYWVFWHEKETLISGGIPPLTKYTQNILESLNTDIVNNQSNIGQWLDIFNVKYVILDKTESLYSNIVLGSGFEKVQTFGNIEIYQNRSMKPRIFSLSSPMNKRAIDLWMGNDIKARWAEGTQEAILSLDSAHSQFGGNSLKSVYQFTDSSAEWLCLQKNVNTIDFISNDVIHLSFYTEHEQPDIHLSLSLFEQDGSKYDTILDAVDGIKAGWNEINFPISLLNLRYSEDENNRLDLDQIEWLWLGIGENSNFDTTHEFEVYFKELSVVSQEVNTNIEYSKIRPGKYEVHVDSDQPSYLVLAESYHPYWVARYNGKEIHSQIIYEALNGFYLEAGNYDVTLEFVSSPWRKAGNFLSGISIVIIGAVVVYLWVRKKRRHQQGIDSEEQREA